MQPNSPKIEILDTTLRDGAQGNGITLSLHDKMLILSALDALGVDYLEAGNPSAGAGEMQFFEMALAMKLQRAEIVAFGATRRAGLSVADDPGCRALLSCGAETISIFGKSWDLHVREILRTTLQENLDMIADTVRFFTEGGRTVLYDAEHFFDGYRHNPGYALDTLGAALGAGARLLVLCDTNGGAFPHDIEAAIAAVQERFPAARIGIHCHNDVGCAVAATVAAVRRGACHVQGTFVGIGERCGNTKLYVAIPDLQLKLGYRCIPPENMALLTPTAHAVSETLNIVLPGATPYVGKYAFGHKAGMHMDGVYKNPVSFEHIDPESVGNARSFLLSGVAGRTAVWRRLKAVLPDITRDGPEVMRMLELIKQREAEGYLLEADASLQMLMLRELGLQDNYFILRSFETVSRGTADCPTAPAQARCTVEVGGETVTTESEGEGPVNALDRALRGALGQFYPSLSRTHLVDYKVRVLESSATASSVRVLIESTDGEEVWTTVGVSRDIIAASAAALQDSITYKLYKLSVQQ